MEQPGAVMVKGGIFPSSFLSAVQGPSSQPCWGSLGALERGMAWLAQQGDFPEQPDPPGSPLRRRWAPGNVGEDPGSAAAPGTALAPGGTCLAWGVVD